MPGLVGFYTFGEGREDWDASRFLYYGLNALQGRGQESISLATIPPRGTSLQITQGQGGVEEFFDKQKPPLGFIGIGQTSSYEQDYIIHVKEPYELALALDGKPDLHSDRAEAIRLFARQLSHQLKEEKDPLKAASQILNKIDGGYSFAALTQKQELLIGRNPLGVKPLEIGGLGFDITAIASETCALGVMGAEHAGQVEPGETVLLTPEHIKRQKGKDQTTNFCSFEYVYLARLDSQVNNVPVAQARNNIGRELAKAHPAKADRVVGVPENGLAYAVGYSQESTIPQELGFSHTGKHTRAALKLTHSERLMGVQLKLNPVRTVVDGKDLVLVDDIVIRGNTLRTTVQDLKRKGAGRVHVRIGSPPLVSPCPFGVEIPHQDELISRSLDQKEIGEFVDADSFAFLTREQLGHAIGLPMQKLCMRCFHKQEEA